MQIKCPIHKHNSRTHQTPPLQDATNAATPSRNFFIFIFFVPRNPYLCVAELLRVLNSMRPPSEKIEGVIFPTHFKLFWRLLWYRVVQVIHFCALVEIWGISVRFDEHCAVGCRVGHDEHPANSFPAVWFWREDSQSLSVGFFLWNIFIYSFFVYDSIYYFWFERCYDSIHSFTFSLVRRARNGVLFYAVQHIFLLFSGICFTVMF